MPRLDQKVVTHKLNVNPKARSIKQPARKYQFDVEEKIKAKVNKLLKSGFIEETKCPEWLPNIVPLKKKGGQIRICVNFRDLNRACPKYFGICNCWTRAFFLYEWLQWLQSDFHGTIICSESCL